MKEVAATLGDDTDIYPQDTAELRRIESEEEPRDLKDLAVEELRTIYGRRYMIYLDVLRKIKRKKGGGLTADEVNKYRTMIHALNGLDEYFAKQEKLKNEPGSFVLRDKQMEVLHELQAFIERDNNSGYVKLPTGTGKTAIFLEMVEAMDMDTIIVVPNNTLVSQLTESIVEEGESGEEGEDEEQRVIISQIEKFAPELAAETGVINMHVKGKKRAEQYGRKIMVITYDSLLNHVKEYNSEKMRNLRANLEEAASQGITDPERILTADELKLMPKYKIISKRVEALRKAGLIIFDEAHRIMGRQRSQLADFFDEQIKIGFTATPYFAENKMLGDVLDEEIYSMPVRRAVEEGLLCGVDFDETATMTVDLSGVVVRRTPFGKDYEEAGLRDVINTAPLRAAAVNIYTERHLGDRAVFYCVGTQHAKDAGATLAENDSFTGAGYRAAFISGEEVCIFGEDRDGNPCPVDQTPLLKVSTARGRALKNDIISRFHNGNVRALFNADLLIEGFDVASASLCMNLRPTLSPVVQEQRCGRVLRLDPNNKNKRARIVDFEYKQPDVTDDTAQPEVQDPDIEEDTSVRRTRKRQIQQLPQIYFSQIYNDEIFREETTETSSQGDGDPIDETVVGQPGVKSEYEGGNAEADEAERKILEMIKEKKMVDFKENAPLPKVIAEAVLDWLRSKTKEQIIEFKEKTFVTPNLMEAVTALMNSSKATIRSLGGKGWVKPTGYDKFPPEHDELSFHKMLNDRQFFLKPIPADDTWLNVLMRNAEKFAFFKMNPLDEDVELFCRPADARELAVEAADEIIDSIASKVPATDWISCGFIVRANFESIKEMHAIVDDLIRSEHRFEDGRTFKELWEGMFGIFQNKEGKLDYYFRKSANRNDFGLVMNAMGVNTEGLTF